jgi:hypothetical protein
MGCIVALMRRNTEKNCTGNEIISAFPFVLVYAFCIKRNGKVDSAKLKPRFCFNRIDSIIDTNTNTNTNTKQARLTRPRV